MEHIILFKCLYMYKVTIFFELRWHRNLLTSSKEVPLCLKQVLVVRGRPFDSWGGGGRYGFFVKKIVQQILESK